MGLSISQMAMMNRLLDEALPLDAVGRQRWLDFLAPEYADLADPLREALSPAGEINDLARMLDTGAQFRHERTLAGPVGGDTVGPYRLLRQLGKGGMAEVWLAQRADGAFQREVALKLPTQSGLRDDLASRFARECDILAALEHANIARLYDAGVSTEGLPYLAMEYVAGEPLIAWCDSRMLGIRERIALFRQVLDAVQYAHARHVIHRDIKPSNILVSGKGHAQLLDFGVAKLLSQTELRTDLTQRYGRALTPNYASPELVRGEAISPSADVYALGVVLYELLSGNIPYYVEPGTPITQMEEIIRTSVVKPPSTQITAGAGRNRTLTERRLAQQLRGDLDAIVLKALAKQPADRYDSASALSDDLQRYLRGEPVTARPDRISYRYGKFARRHQTALLVTVSAVAVIGTLGYGLSQRTLNSVSADVPVPVPVGDKSIAVLPFLDLSEKKDQEYFSDGLSEQLIDHLVHYADLKVISRTSSFQFKGKNEDIRSVGRQLGVTNVLEGSVTKVGQQLRITAQLIRTSDGVSLWSQSYNRSLDDIFKVQDEIGDKVSTALNAALHDRPPQSRQPDVQAFNLVLEGNYLRARGTAQDSADAGALYRRAIDIDPGYSLAWARLASAYMDQEVYQGPVTPEQSKRVLDALDHALQLDPANAWAYYTRGGFEMAIAWDWDAAQADVERIQRVDPRFDLLPVALGDVALTFGEVDRAVVLYQNELARNPLSPGMLDALSTALCAANQLQKCLQTRQQLLQLHPEFGGAQRGLAIAYMYLGRLDTALATMLREPNESYRLAGLALIYFDSGKQTMSDAALSEFTTKFGSMDPYGVAEIYAYRGQPDEAFQWLNRAFDAHSARMQAVKADPLLRKLWVDARFHAMLGRMKLGEKAQLEDPAART